MSNKDKNKEIKTPEADTLEPVVGEDGLTDEERKILDDEAGTSNNNPPEMPTEAAVVDELEDLPLEQLKGIAIGLGMSPTQAGKFTTKAPLVATIQLVRQSKVVVPQGAGVNGDIDLDVVDLALRDRQVVDAEGNVVVKKAVRDNDRNDREVFESRKERIKRVLDAQPKVQVFVPRDFGEKAGAILPVTINGYRFSILKGVMVNVPQGVYDVIKNSMEATERAGAEFALDRVKYDEQLGQNVNVRDRL